MSEKATFFVGINLDHLGNTIIITAGGTGKRMGADLPKQFLLLAGKPVLFHTIQRFFDFDPSAQIIVSLPADWCDYWKELCENHQFPIQHEVVEGGKERFHSIQNALQSATGNLIGVHDGVRPFPGLETIRQCFATAGEKGNAIPVVEVKESIREIAGEKSQALIRSNYRLVQTPQVFSADVLRKAYNQEYHDGITDDASLVESCGVQIQLVPGNETNIKITNPTDLMLAEMILKNT